MKIRSLANRKASGSPMNIRSLASKEVSGSFMKISSLASRKASGPLMEIRSHIYTTGSSSLTCTLLSLVTLGIIVPLINYCLQAYTQVQAKTLGQSKSHNVDFAVWRVCGMRVECKWRKEENDFQYAFLSTNIFTNYKNLCMCLIFVFHLLNLQP